MAKQQPSLLVSPQRAFRWRGVLALGGVSLGLLVVGAILHLRSQPAPPADDPPTALDYRRGRQPVVGLADADRLREQYEFWKSAVEEPSQIRLFPSRSIDAPAATSGWVRLYPDEDLLVSEIHGLVDEPVDLWLVDNVEAPGGSAAVEPTDRVVHAGTYSYGDGVAHLRRAMSDLVDSEFLVDRLVVTPFGGLPQEGGLFHGSPTLFQRLWAQEKRMDREGEERSVSLMSLAVVVQSGGVPTGFPQIFQDLVTEGEDLFFNETFAGNTRTCGTCHFAANDFTIDADLIATLPPKDPLFLAEFSLPHIFGSKENRDDNGNPRRFENPDLMRGFGLILENLDGFGDLDDRFVMRGVPHNIGMIVSVTAPPSPSEIEGPVDRTGWSGDGSPFGPVGCPSGPVVTTTGSVRDFAVGAVRQHFPKTLDRNFCGPNADFRLPAEHELDAVAAFLFGLGRQAELDIEPGGLVLSDSLAEMGKVLFRDPEASAAGNPISCNLCHTNAGANSTVIFGGTNGNLNTNVELFIQQRLGDPTFTAVGEPRPVDGGFGTDPNGGFSNPPIATPPFVNEHFGNGEFNLVSLVEAADSAPFFHPNSAFTLEDSIDFYESEEFASRPGGGGSIIEFDDAERAAVAAFMRAINALDNLENLAIPRAQKAIKAFSSPVFDPSTRDDVINFLLLVAIADATDAREVLRLSHINSQAAAQIRVGMNFLRQAQNRNLSDEKRIAKIQDAIGRLQSSVALIRVSP